MQIIFYEDETYIKPWLPILRLNSVFKMSFLNPFFLKKKVLFIPRAELPTSSRKFPGLEIHKRPHLEEDAFFFSSFFIPSHLKPLKRNTILIWGDEAVGFFFKKNTRLIRTLAKSSYKDYDLEPVSGKLIDTPFKLISKFDELLNEYLNSIKKKYKKIKRKLYSDSVIPRNVEIDTENGIVIIEKDVKIEPFSFIKGPAFIGRETIIKSGAKIYSSYIGPVCRIGGEVDTSIFIGYANKAHEGFIGHSIIGEWVNLGAMTTNSDLKNNYSEVRVKIRDEIIPTRTIKFGAIIGDHVKTGIGTLIPTGAYIDVFCNIFSGGKFCPKYLPPFSWVSEEKIEIYQLDKAIETALKMMRRRGIGMDEEYEERIREIFKEEIEKK